MNFEVIRRASGVLKNIRCGSTVLGKLKRGFAY